MFREIVSNLAFSPTLVGQLGFYAKRLKREEVTRRAGLIFTALALVVQSLTVFTPPQAANAASAADFISGGVANKQEFLQHYDNNTNRIRGLFTSLGITRANVVNMTEGKIHDVRGKFNWSRVSLYSAAQGEKSYTFNNGAGDVTFYNRPLALTQEGTLPYPVLVGHSDTLGWFAIKKDCGNLITTTQPNNPKPSVVCVRLNVVKIEDYRYRATARATKDNATINGFRFVIEGKEDRRVDTHATEASTEFRQKEPGTYTVRAYVLSPETGPVTSADCRDTFTIRETSVPSAECISVTPNIVERTKVSFTGTGSVKNGASITKYVFKVKNKSGDVIKTFTKETGALAYTTEQMSLTPGEYKISLLLKTSVGDQQGGNCNADFTISPEPIEPFVECSLLSYELVNRTIVSLTGEAVAGNGGAVKSYQFVVKNKNGSVVHTATKPGPALKVTANSFTLSKPGEYTAILTLDTTVGDRTGANCQTKFTIAEPNVCQYNPSLPENSPECQPCPSNPNLWIKDEDCTTPLVTTKTATNMTHGNVNATTVTAKAGDRISYTLTVENRDSVAQKTTVTENLADVLEYAKLTQLGGGTFDDATKVLSWGEETIEPGKKVTHTLVIQMLDTIPSTNTGASNGASYDCVMTNTFGNSLGIGVDCPIEKKIIEQTVTTLPSTGPTENMMFAGIVGSIVTFFYARSRQLGREVRLIRKDFNMGTI